MATNSNPLQIAAAQQQTAQAKADGMPQWVITRYPGNIGVRNSGNTMPQPYDQTGGPGVLGPGGYIAGSPQDPAVSPVLVLPVSSMATPYGFTPPPQKLMQETSTYVPGKGWVNSATTN